MENTDAFSGVVGLTQRHTQHPSLPPRVWPSLPSPIRVARTWLCRARPSPTERAASSGGTWRQKGATASTLQGSSCTQNGAQKKAQAKNGKSQPWKVLEETSLFASVLGPCPVDVPVTKTL